MFLFFDFTVIEHSKKTKQTRNLKKILRKSPASNTCAGIFKNADFSQSSLKITKFSKLTLIASVKPN